MHHRLPVCKLSSCIYALLAVCTFSTGVSAAPDISSDWAQFQGPNRDATSPENNLAHKWPENGPRELWSAPLGDGYGGPSVRDGEVYIVDRIGELQDVLRCYYWKVGKNYGIMPMMLLGTSVIPVRGRPRP